ncbi:hypothetical protein HDR63_03520 [bacterium]|nr:hypothetical protein [bacterium]
MVQKKTSLPRRKSLYQILKNGFNTGAYSDIQTHLLMARGTMVHSYTLTTHFFRLVCTHWRDSDTQELYGLALFYPSGSKDIYGQTAKRFYHLIYNTRGNR